MIFIETKLKGAYIIDLERREDSRGFFARGFCQHEFAAHGLKPVIAQANIALQPTERYGARDAFPVSTGGRNQARALHAGRRFSTSSSISVPRVTDVSPAHRGRVDRRQSPCHLRSGAFRARLSGARGQHRTRAISAASSTRLRRRAVSGYDDPRLGLKWPLPVAVISDKDQVLQTARRHRSQS